MLPGSWEQQKESSSSANIWPGKVPQLGAPTPLQRQAQLPQRSLWRREHSQVSSQVGCRADPEGDRWHSGAPGPCPLLINICSPTPAPVSRQDLSRFLQPSSSSVRTSTARPRDAAAARASPQLHQDTASQPQLPPPAESSTWDSTPGLPQPLERLPHPASGRRHSVSPPASASRLQSSEFTASTASARTFWLLGKQGPAGKNPAEGHSQCQVLCTPLLHARAGHALGCNLHCAHSGSLSLTDSASCSTPPSNSCIPQPCGVSRGEPRCTRTKETT